MTKPKPCRRCEDCGKPIRCQKHNKSGLCSMCSGARARKKIYAEKSHQRRKA